MDGTLANFPTQLIGSLCTVLPLLMVKKGSSMDGALAKFPLLVVALRFFLPR